MGRYDDYSLHVVWISGKRRLHRKHPEIRSRQMTGEQFLMIKEPETAKRACVYKIGFIWYNPFVPWYNVDMERHCDNY